MVNNLQLMFKLIGFKFFRAIGYPKIMPMNVTVAVTNKCTSLCKTCNLGRRYIKNPSVADNDLTLEEYKKIFRSIGKNNVSWFVFSGAEPFMRNDLVEIVKYAYDYCNPDVIVLPTNTLPGNILEKVEELLKYCKKTIINVNLSLDGIGEKHDKIRGIKGNFEKVLLLFRELRKLKSKYKNFELNIHTVISKYNFSEIENLHKYVLKEIKPDAHITEIAENKKEIENLNLDITPQLSDYKKTINILSDLVKKEKFKGFTKLKQLARIEYYGLVKEIFKKRTQVIPCYAAINECQISPAGEVWNCSLMGRPMGDLRQNNYDFRKIWKSEKAKNVRRSIKNKECWCPVANIAYTNMMCDLKRGFKIGWRFLFGQK